MLLDVGELRDPVAALVAAGLRREVIAARLVPRGPLGLRLSVGYLTEADWHVDLPLSLVEPDIAAEVLRECAEQWRRRHPGAVDAPVVRLRTDHEYVWSDRVAQWTYAAQSLADEAVWDLTFVLVCRDGWWDPRSGYQKRWLRIRNNGVRLPLQPPG